jgi:ATP-dependent RNA helicase RhlE
VLQIAPMKSYDPSLAIDDFSKMNLDSRLLTALAKANLVKPTPIQCDAIPLALTGSDLVAVAQTGSGKTLAYALSVMTMLEKKPEARALVLTPSRETAEQVHRVIASLCEDLPISLCLAVSGIPDKIQTSQLKKNPRIIVATPGRLNDHVTNNKLLLKGLEFLVIDEADRMLDMGFEPQLKFIQSTLRGTWQTLMFAATLGEWAKPIAQMFMRPDPILIRTASAGTPVETLHQKVFFLSKSQKDNRMLDQIKKMKSGVIVFADSQESCVAIGRLLAHHGFSSDFVHGDMKPGHRNRILREFREEKIQTLVTTDLLARGLDVPHVNHIINYDLPYKTEDFLHRIGRTARAGREGSAITFITPADGRAYRKIKPYLAGAAEETLATKFEFIDE